MGFLLLVLILIFQDPFVLFASCKKKATLGLIGCKIGAKSIQETE